MPETPTVEQLVQAVRKYAQEHYNEGDWDYIVEGCEDEDIAEAIDGATTIDEAIKNIAFSVGTMADFQVDHTPTAEKQH